MKPKPFSHPDKKNSGRGICGPGEIKKVCRNIRLTLEYDGTNYCGWQVQTRNSQKRSIQQVLERTLRDILHQKVNVLASGRTDAGVHALAQTVNFNTFSRLSVEKIKGALNALLPDDIIVASVSDERGNFHAIRSAKAKTYRYLILNRKQGSALLRNRAHSCYFPLDIKIMQKEARALVGRHDFKGFCASGASSKTSIRTIKSISVKRISYDSLVSGLKSRDDSLIAITIEADGFLYNMVRNIVGTLIEVGRGRFSPGTLQKALLSKDRRMAGPTAPAKGLYLLKAAY